MVILQPLLYFSVGCYIASIVRAQDVRQMIVERIFGVKGPRVGEAE